MTLLILDRDKYVAEAMRQLNDREVDYIPLRDDRTVDMIFRRLKGELKNYIMMGILANQLFNIRVNNDAKAARFYLLPKIHKKNCPGRPVISGCNTDTEKISAFVDSQLKPLVS